MLDKSQFTESQVEIVKHLRDESERTGMWIGCILTLTTILGIVAGVIIAGNIPYIY